MIEQLILIVHVIIAMAIIGLILLQQGKGADMGASFGGGGSQTLFGAAGGGSVLTRATAILVTLFFVSSFGLAVVAKQKSVDVAVTDGLSELETMAEGIERQLDKVNAEVSEGDIPVEIIQQDSLEPIDFVDEIPQ